MAVGANGTDFNGIFAGLDDGSYDCIASGTTITPERSKDSRFLSTLRGLGPIARCRRHAGSADQTVARVGATLPA
jgi:hypothetical protein